MANTKAKLRVASKSAVDQLSQQTLLATNSEAALPLLSMIGQAQLSIEDARGQDAPLQLQMAVIDLHACLAGSQFKGMLAQCAGQGRQPFGFACAHVALEALWVVGLHMPGRRVCCA